MSKIKNSRMISLTYYQSVATGGIKWTTKVAVGFNPNVVFIRSLIVLGGETTQGRCNYALRSNIEKNNDIIGTCRIGGIINYNDIVFTPNLFNLDNGYATFEILQTDSTAAATTGSQNWIIPTNLSTFCNVVVCLQFIEYEK